MSAALWLRLSEGERWRVLSVLDALSGNAEAEAEMWAEKTLGRLGQRRVCAYEAKAREAAQSYRVAAAALRELTERRTER